MASVSRRGLAVALALLSLAAAFLVDASLTNSERVSLQASSIAQARGQAQALREALASEVDRVARMARSAESLPALRSMIESDADPETYDDFFQSEDLWRAYRTPPISSSVTIGGRRIVQASLEVPSTEQVEKLVKGANADGQARLIWAEDTLVAVAAVRNQIAAAGKHPREVAIVVAKRIELPALAGTWILSDGRTVLAKKGADAELGSVLGHESEGGRVMGAVAAAAVEVAPRVWVWAFTPVAEAPPSSRRFTVFGLGALLALLALAFGLRAAPSDPSRGTDLPERTRQLVAPTRSESGAAPTESIRAPADAEQFGRYRLISRLGHGGMAWTWKALMVGAAGVSKPVVIKRILPHLANNESFVREFINEAKVTSTLSHGNLAQVFEFGQIDGQYFLAIEYVHGRTLEALLDAATRRGFATFPTPIAIFIVAEMLKGLHYAHTRTDESGRPLAIVHRDISPDNVLLGFDGQTKVVDFGVAKSLVSGRTETEPGLVKGKWHYFSPEQASAEALDGRSDVFATGVVLYRLLCNQLPFIGESQQAMWAIVRGEYPPPASVNPALSPALAKVVACALEVSPKNRYADAQKMEEALRVELAKQASPVSNTELAHFVRWLFEDELTKEGLDLAVPTKAREAFERWLSSGRTRAMAPSVAGGLQLSLRRSAPWLGLAAALGAALSTLAWLLKEQ